MGEDLNQKIDKKQQSLGQEIMQQAAQLPEDAAERALLRERAQLFTQFSEAIESVQDAINDVENEVVRNGYLQALLQAIQLINPETLAVAMVNFKRAKDAIETNIAALSEEPILAEPIVGPSPKPPRPKPPLPAPIIRPRLNDAGDLVIYVAGENKPPGEIEPVYEFPVFEPLPELSIGDLDRMATGEAEVMDLDAVELDFETISDDVVTLQTQLAAVEELSGSQGVLNGGVNVIQGMLVEGVEESMQDLFVQDSLLRVYALLYAIRGAVEDGEDPAPYVSRIADLVSICEGHSPFKQDFYEYLAVMNTIIEDGDALLEEAVSGLDQELTLVEEKEAFNAGCDRARDMYLAGIQQLNEFVEEHEDIMTDEAYNLVLMRKDALTEKMLIVEEARASYDLQELVQQYPEYYELDPETLGLVTKEAYDELSPEEQEIMNVDVEAFREMYYYDVLMGLDTEGALEFQKPFYEGRQLLGQGDMMGAKASFLAYIENIQETPEVMVAQELERIDMAEEWLKMIAMEELAEMQGYLSKMYETVSVQGSVTNKRKLNMPVIQAQSEIEAMMECVWLCQGLVERGEVLTIERAKRVLGCDTNAYAHMFRTPQDLEDYERLKDQYAKLKEMNDGVFDVFALYEACGNSMDQCDRGKILEQARLYRANGFYELAELLFDRYFADSYETAKKERPELTREGYEETFDNDEKLQKTLDRKLRKREKQAVKDWLVEAEEQFELENPGEKFDEQAVRAELEGGVVEEARQEWRTEIRDELIDRLYEEEFKKGMCDYFQTGLARGGYNARIWEAEYNDMMEFDREKYEIWRMTDEGLDSLIQDLPVEIFMMAISFGVASRGAKFVGKKMVKRQAKKFLAKKMLRNFPQKIAKKKADDAVELIMKRGGLKLLKKTMRASMSGTGYYSMIAAAGGVGFLAENTAFVTVHGGLAGMTSGHWEMFSGKQEYKEAWNRSFITLAVLKLAGGAYGGTLGRLGARTAQRGGMMAIPVRAAHGAGSMTTQVASLTGTGYFETAVMEAEYMSDADIADMVLHNTVITVAFTGGHMGANSFSKASTGRTGNAGRRVMERGKGRKERALENRKYKEKTNAFTKTCEKDVRTLKKLVLSGIDKIVIKLAYHVSIRERWIKRGDEMAERLTVLEGEAVTSKQIDAYNEAVRSYNEFVEAFYKFSAEVDYAVLMAERSASFRTDLADLGREWNAVTEGEVVLTLEGGREITWNVNEIDAEGNVWVSTEIEGRNRTLFQEVKWIGTVDAEGRITFRSENGEIIGPIDQMKAPKRDRRIEQERKAQEAVRAEEIRQEMEAELGNPEADIESFVRGLDESHLDEVIPRLLERSAEVEASLAGSERLMVAQGWILGSKFHKITKSIGLYEPFKPVDPIAKRVYLETAQKYNDLYREAVRQRRDELIRERDQAERDRTERQRAEVEQRGLEQIEALRQKQQEFLEFEAELTSKRREGELSVEEIAELVDRYNSLEEGLNLTGVKTKDARFLSEATEGRIHARSRELDKVWTRCERLMGDVCAIKLGKLLIEADKMFKKPLDELTRADLEALESAQIKVLEEVLKSYEQIPLPRRFAEPLGQCYQRTRRIREKIEEREVEKREVEERKTGGRGYREQIRDMRMTEEQLEGYERRLDDGEFDAGIEGRMAELEVEAFAAEQVVRNLVSGNPEGSGVEALRKSFREAGFEEVELGSNEIFISYLEVYAANKKARYEALRRRSYEIGREAPAARAERLDLEFQAELDELRLTKTELEGQRASVLESAREGRLQPSLEMTLERLNLEVRIIERVLSGEVRFEFDNLEGEVFAGGRVEGFKDLFVKYNFASESPASSLKYRVFLESYMANKKSLLEFYKEIQGEAKSERNADLDLERFEARVEGRWLDAVPERGRRAMELVDEAWEVLPSDRDMSGPGMRDMEAGLYGFGLGERPGYLFDFSLDTAGGERMVSRLREQGVEARLHNNKLLYSRAAVEGRILAEPKLAELLGWKEGMDVDAWVETGSPSGTGVERGVIGFVLGYPKSAVEAYSKGFEAADSWEGIKIESPGGGRALYFTTDARFVDTIDVRMARERMDQSFEEAGLDAEVLEGRRADRERMREERVERERVDRERVEQERSAVEEVQFQEDLDCLRMPEDVAEQWVRNSRSKEGLENLLGDIVAEVELAEQALRGEGEVDGSKIHGFEAAKMREIFETNGFESADATTNSRYKAWLERYVENNKTLVREYRAELEALGEFQAEVVTVMESAEQALRARVEEASSLGELAVIESAHQGSSTRPVHPYPDAKFRAMWEGGTGSERFVEFIDGLGSRAPRDRKVIEREFGKALDNYKRLEREVITERRNQLLEETVAEVEAEPAGPRDVRVDFEYGAEVTIPNLGRAQRQAGDFIILKGDTVYERIGGVPRISTVTDGNVLSLLKGQLESLGRELKRIKEKTEGKEGEPSAPAEEGARRAVAETERRFEELTDRLRGVDETSEVGSEMAREYSRLGELLEAGLIEQAEYSRLLEKLEVIGGERIAEIRRAEWPGIETPPQEGDIRIDYPEGSTGGLGRYHAKRQAGDYSILRGDQIIDVAGGQKRVIDLDPAEAERIRPKALKLQRSIESEREGGEPEGERMTDETSKKMRKGQVGLRMTREIEALDDLLATKQIEQAEYDQRVAEIGKQGMKDIRRINEE